MLPAADWRARLASSSRPLNFKLQGREECKKRSRVNQACMFESAHEWRERRTINGRVCGKRVWEGREKGRIKDGRKKSYRCRKGASVQWQ